MNKKRVKDLDDLDVVLDDLLAEDGPSVKTSVKKKSGKPGVRDDDFYSSLAAAAADNEVSDVSDADPVEMAKQLEDLDELDAALFDSKKKPQKKSSDLKTEKSAENKGKLPGKPPAKKNILDSIDDPLADLLSDEEDEKPKPKVSSKKSLSTRKDSIEEDSDKSQGSKRLDIERPPTRSGTNSGGKAAPSPTKHKQTADVFDDDDDDVLGGMGLVSPRHGSPKTGAGSGNDSSHRPGGAKSILDELLGSGSKPATADSKGNLLDTKSSTKNKQPNKETAKDVDDDFVFGTYTPSAATGSRPSSRRSVRFEQTEDLFGDRSGSRSVSPGKRRSASSHLEALIADDDRDWLDMASRTTPAQGSKQASKETRPSSEGDIRKKTEPALEATSGSASSEPVDWLGLARLGSPDITPRTPDDEKGIKHEMKTKTTSQSAPTKTDSKTNKAANAGDYDEEELPFSRSSRTKTPPGAKAKLDQKDNTSKGNDEWLAKSDQKPSTGDDYLGLGDEDIDVEDILKVAPPRSTRDDSVLFSVPQPRVSSSLPWNAERPRFRRDHSLESQPSDADPKIYSSLDGLQHSEMTSTPSRAATRRRSTSSRQTGEDELFTCPNLFDDTPALSRSSQQTASRHSNVKPSPHTSDTVPQDTTSNREQDRSTEQHKKQKSLQNTQQMDFLKERPHPQQSNLQHTSVSQTFHRQYETESSFLPPEEGVKAKEVYVKVQKLEMEKNHLQMILDTMKTQHLEEVKMIEDSYKKRMDMLEDMWQKRENRLREENCFLSKESLQQLKKLEEEKAEMMSNQLRQIEIWEREKEAEIRRLKQVHSNALDDLRAEHQRALEMIRKSKNQELEAVISASDHARHLQAVINRVEDHASSLDDLQQKVSGQHLTHLDQREKALRDKDQELKAMQECLKRQQHENEKERAKLEALITKLEIQLTEQTRQTEQEKWQLRQEQSRLQSAQKALEQERKLLLEEVEREKREVEKAKTQLLEEQKTILGQLAGERQALAQERAQFNIKYRLRMDDELKESVKVKQDSVELEASLRVVNEEKARLTAESHQLALEREKLKLEQDHLIQEKRLVQIEQQKLEELAKEVNQKSRDIQELCMKAAQVRNEGQSALAAVQNKEKELKSREESLNKQLKILRDRERQIAEERLSLAKEKHEFEKQQGEVLCVNCRTPVRDQSVPVGSPYRMTPTAHSLFNSLAPDLQRQVQSDLTTDISAAIEMDKLVRQWHKSAQKDKAFLTEERMYLRALKSSPYHQDQTDPLT